MTTARAVLGAGRRRKVVAPMAITGVGMMMASAAWACHPGTPGIGLDPTTGDGQTRFASCTPPAGATRPCKAMLNTPAFPNATAIKGPPGSGVVAFVGGGLERGKTHMLRFLSKPQLDSGIACHSGQSTSIGGPTVSDSGGALARTNGTIPTTAPVGGGQVCFADVANMGGSVPAKFKVII